MSQISASRSCNTPGYTGEFCEFPICFETNPKLPYIPDDETVAIDAATLAFCTQTYVIFVDETMFDITIDLDMDSPLNPSFALEGEDGQAYLPDGILTQTRDQFQAFYAWLPPGRYLVIPTADLTTSSCILSIRSRTLITINAGFLVGEGTETERSDSPQSYTFYNEPASVVLHANFLRSPAKLQSINFIGEENTLYRPRLLSSRFNCSYEYIFESFYCKKTGSYLYQVEGVTFQGFNFRRLFTFSCLMNPETTVAPPSTPAPTQPSKCSNNGVLITNLDGTTYCYCMGLFTGADCAQRVCANGGTPDANNKCLCQDGFIGEFCENVYCSDNTGMTFDAEHPTLTLVVRTRTQLADVINQVSGAVQSLVNDLTFDPEYLTHFVLVLFNNNTVNTNTYPSASLLLTALNDASKTKDASGGCTDVDLIALGAALSQYLTYKSPVYVITDALPSDGSEADNDYHLINDWRSPVYFIYLEPLVEAGCQTTIEDPAYRIMDTVAQRSAGQTFYFKDRTGIRNFLTQHMLNTLYRTQLLLSNDLQLCREQNVFKSISVDSSVELLVIVATGNGISLVLTTPDGDFADADKVFTDGMNHICWRKPHLCNWLFSFLTTDATQGCNYKVYQSVYHANVSLKVTAIYNISAGRSNQMDLFWSTSINLDSDVGLPQPLYGLQHAFVMHLTNYPVGVPPERVQAFLTISANRGGKPTQVYASNGIWRDVCTYNFYFPPFACKIPNELFHFNFFAQDLLGFAIQRAGVMYCAEFSPPPPPQSECQNGGVMNAANTTCFCPPGFTGDTCTQVVCFNGGKYVGNQCSCPVGWTGSFCEIAKCVDKGFSPEFMLENVDMIFMVELTAQAHAQLVFLNMQFADMIRDIQAQSRTWINRFYLVGYNSTWADVMAVSTTRDPHNIVDEMTKLASQIPTDTGCRVQLWQGLEKVLRWNIPMGSFVQIFQTSPEDNGNLDNVGQLYDALRSLFINTNGFLSFTPTFTPNGFACNASQIDYATMFMMTGGSAGTVYPIQPANTANMVQVIPLQYSSAQVYGQFSFHCKQPMEVYFPIDAYTQTIQLDTFGFQKTVQIFDGNGKAVDAFNLMSDPFSGWDIYELRKDCEDGWDKFGQYCLQFVVSAMNYTDAQNFCHQAGGSIVDDMNDGKHQFIASTAHGFNFWIGLYNNASMYLWDRPDYVDPLPLSQTKQYWVGGMGEPVYDPNAACVYWDDSVTNSNTWTLGSCASKLPFICQKHQYDKDHRPNVIGDDDLPAGKWSVSITVAPTAGQLEVCSVAVRVQSSLQIITGFTTDVAQDYPYLDPIFDSRTFYNAATYQPRVGCSFPWVSQTFACPNGQQAINEIIIAHIGEDEFGNMFQRLTFAHCNEAGRYCTVPICVNGGVLSASDTTCICPKGYTGPNCQLEMCTKRSPLAFSMDYKTLVLVVEVTQQNMNVVKELISSLSSIVQTATANNPNWFVNYVLVTFDSTGSTSKASFTTIGALVLSLNSAANRATDAGKCTLPIYT
ncbi:unnamed protein product [Heligmosomoides polygyrus]|uniref:EGF-like domain-containing protein n=1 Tax=Heligmosomoides polygyrus TaxID=6339 RepID=A0A3P7Z055_HELPZ|nr:unnamed protein product [Heligmosomoides polygyrus]